MKSDKNLWLRLCCRTGGLEHIYGYGREPSLSGVEIQYICFNFGEDMYAQLSFITREMPRQLPEKWRQRGVNAVRIVLDLINVRVNSFTTQSANMQNAGMNIVETAEDGKFLRIFDQNGNEVTSLYAQFVAVNGMSGITVDDGG